MLFAVVLCISEGYASDKTALSKPARLFVNGVENYVETFVIDNNNYYKLQDIAFVFRDLIPRFTYSIQGGQIKITTKQNYLPSKMELRTSRPGRYSAALYANSISVDGRTVDVQCYKINNDYCLSESSIGQIFDCGRKELPQPGYYGVSYQTNFKHSPTIGKLSIKEPDEIGNLSYNLGRGGFALAYKGFIFFIHNKKLYRMNSDGTELKDLKTKAAHSLNGRRDRVYFYDMGYKVSSIALDGSDKRSEGCPLYAGVMGQEPWALTYVGDMVFCKYNNRPKGGSWCDEIRWYATSGYSEDIIYRINTEKRIIGDFFIDGSKVFFNINWFNFKDLDNVGSIWNKGDILKLNVVQPFVYKDKIYFKNRDDNKIYSISRNGSAGAPRLVYDLPLNRFYIVDDKIIFQKKEGIHVVSLNGGDSSVKTLIPAGVKNFNIAGDWIIYANHSLNDYAKVGLIKVDGSKKVSIPAQ